MARKNKFNIAAFCEHMESLLGGQEGEAKVFWKALSFAVSAHEGQRRKSGEAYVSHPCMVAQILVDELDVRDPVTLAAAVLHDTMEDVPEVTNEVIGEIFGKDVEEIVEGLTKITSFSGDKQNFYKLVHRKIFSGAASRIDIMLVKLADRLHNLRTLNSLPKHKRQKIADETLDIYAPMAKVIGLYNLKRELYDLALTFKFPRQSQKVLAMIRRLRKDDELLAIQKRLKTELENAWINCELGFRIKGLWAYYDPFHQVLAKRIENPVELLVATTDIQSCYRALGIINQLYPPIPRTIRDFIANPKASGYQCLHTRANIKGRNYLFKIRTQEMLESGRSGIIKAWSSNRKVPSSFEREVREMFNILGKEDEISYRDMIAASGKKEIYTYTPKGDTISLPKQSTVLDFAFKIHTEIGSRCTHAKIGQKIVKPDAILNDGDQVEITCQKEPVNFHPDIQELCQSPRARAELSKMFRYRREIQASKIGDSILNQEMKLRGIPPQILERDEMEEILEFFDLKTLEELYIAIGEGRLGLAELIKEIAAGPFAGKKIYEPSAESRNRYELENLDPACIKLSRCCNPIPTEQGLIGLLSERGLSVHRPSCHKLRTLRLVREDLIELSWRLKKSEVIKPQTLLLVEKTSRNRALMMLGVAPEEMKIVEVISLSQRPSSKTPWEIIFTVANLQGLKNILSHFEKSGMTFEFDLEL